MVGVFFPAWTSVLIGFIVQLNGRDGKLQGWVQRRDSWGGNVINCFSLMNALCYWTLV